MNREDPGHSEDVEPPGHLEDDGGHWGSAVFPSDTEPPEPGDLVVNPVLGATPEPLVGTGLPSPLAEDEPEGTVPPSPLWAMKARRHVQWQLPIVGDHERIREAIGTGDDTAFLIDDGKHHAMVGRQVGVSVDGCDYALVGRISLEWCDALRQGSVPADRAFDEAHDLALCGVVVDEPTASANVFDVARYPRLADVPEAYRPGAPYLRFQQDLEITAY